MSLFEVGRHIRAVPDLLSPTFRLLTLVKGPWLGPWRQLPVLQASMNCADVATLSSHRCPKSSTYFKTRLAKDF